MENVTVKTPGVKSRGEAWVAWEASLVSRFGDKIKRPKSNFWKRWDKTFLHMFDVVSFKQYSGEVVIRSNGHEHKSNILNGKASDWNRNSFIWCDIKPEYADFAKARAWLRPKTGDHFTFNNAMLMVDWPELYKAHQVRSWGPDSRKAAIAYGCTIMDGSDKWINTYWTTDGIKEVVMERDEYVILWVLGDVRANSLQGLVTAHLELGLWTK